MMWAWHANRAEPAQTHFLSMTVLPNFLHLLHCLPFIPITVCLLSFNLSFSSHLIFASSFSFYFEVWNTSFYAIRRRSQIQLGGNMAEMWNPSKKNSVMKRSLLEGSVERATHSAPSRAVLIYQSSRKGWAGSTRLRALCLDHGVIITFLTHGSWQDPNF